jgi:hypothetical protein
MRGRGDEAPKRSRSKCQGRFKNQEDKKKEGERVGFRD